MVCKYILVSYYAWNLLFILANQQMSLYKNMISVADYYYLS